MGMWEWGVGGWRVCGGPLEFGFSSQRNVSGFEVSQLPTLLIVMVLGSWPSGI